VGAEEIEPKFGYRYNYKYFGGGTAMKRFPVRTIRS